MDCKLPPVGAPHLYLWGGEEGVKVTMLWVMRLRCARAELR